MARTITLAPRVGKTVPLKSAASPPPFAAGARKPAVPAAIEQRPIDDGATNGKGTAGNYSPPAAAVGAGFPIANKPGTGEVE